MKFTNLLLLIVVKVVQKISLQILNAVNAKKAQIPQST